MVRIMNYTGQNDLNIFDLYIDIRPSSSSQILEMSRDIISKGFQRQFVRNFFLALPKTHSPWRPGVWKTSCRLVKYDSTSDSSKAAAIPAIPFQKHLWDMHSNDATDLNVLHLESRSFRSWGH